MADIYKGTPFTENNRPGWIGDVLTRDHVLAGGAKIAAATFPYIDGVKAVVGVAGAAQGATTVPVAALSGPIPAGTVLDFGGSKFARLTADAAKGAPSLAVTALVTALVSGDSAVYATPGTTKRVPSGTLVGLTNAQLESGAAGVEWHAAQDTDDVVRFVLYDVVDVNTLNDADFYRPGSLVYVNLLPSWAALSNTLKAKVRQTYECSVGAPLGSPVV